MVAKCIYLSLFIVISMMFSGCCLLNLMKVGALEKNLSIVLYGAFLATDTCLQNKKKFVHGLLVSDNA